LAEKEKERRGKCPFLTQGNFNPTRRIFLKMLRELPVANLLEKQRAQSNGYT
jgi:hypothetical protein